MPNAPTKKTLRLLFTDQLTHTIASLADIDKKHDVVLLAETMEEATYVAHHKHKLILQFSAMRHFAEELKVNNINVDYIKIDKKVKSLDKALKDAISKHKPDHIVLTHPGEYRLLEKIHAWQKQLTQTVTLLDDDRFYLDLAKFKAYTQEKGQLRLENFYRMMRKKSGLLMTKTGKPLRGKWNFDADNRNNWDGSPKLPTQKALKNDSITQTVMKTIAKLFHHHMGTAETFHYAVTRKQALNRLDYFIKHILPNFGDFQDAMHTSDPFMFHSVLSPYLNLGLLTAKEVCDAAEKAYLDESAPINAVEGFIRQILGWREFIRGVYWVYMPAYANKNYLNSKRDLPAFYWDAETDMNCLHHAIKQTVDYAYAHHIQRLMITGNFALLAGLDIKQVCEWYLLVYADAYDWVELPNTLGMSLFADGGLFATKPYAASGKYINRMSNYCKGCIYNPNESVGDSACPYNSLYWHFMHRNEKTLRSNQRLTYTYASWGKMKSEKKKALLAQAEQFLKTLGKPHD